MEDIIPAKINTTVIGSYPRPAELHVPNWFDSKWEDVVSGKQVKEYNEILKNPPELHEYNLLKATKELIEFQDEIGINVMTDGEFKREQYIYYHCRHLEGFDFENLKRHAARNGAYEAMMPVISGKISNKKHFLANDFLIGNLFCKNNQLKVTIPGPMTIMDTVCNKYYAEDVDQLYEDLSQAINTEIKNLVQQGCKNVQIDEPVIARYPEEAVRRGIKYLNKCLEGLPSSVNKMIHICCGYPERLDQEDYPKADPSAYFHVAQALEAAENIEFVSIEDAHRKNDLAQLLPLFKRIKIILGVIDISRSKVETSEAIAGRLREALKYIDAERLWIAPDCGLGYLPKELAEQKLKNMCEAAKIITNELNSGSVPN